MQENTLSIRELSKRYPSFHLDGVSFSVKPGRIVGFIGRNGAGKTTTLKCICHLVKPDGGELLYGEQDIQIHEAEFKNEVGILLGEFDYYPAKTIRALTGVTKRFYDKWDENLYRRLLSEFALDENKQIKALSSGMKVKYGLALALSHGAKLLILDEPTSGLDPVSRDELLDLFLDLVKKEGCSILFSTHVISDLEKCADDIVYIKQGKIVVEEEVESFEASYLHISGDSSACAPWRGRCIFEKERLGKFEGIAKKEGELPPEVPGIEVRKASLEEIMIAFERGEA